MPLLNEILYWSPLAILLGILVFLIIFFKTDLLRKYRIRYLIYRNRLVRFIKHMIHGAMYIVRISALIKIIFYAIIAIAVLVGLVFLVIFFYNMYIVALLEPIVKLKPIYISLNSITGLLFSRQTNPIYVVGFILGSALSAFMRPKIERFTEKVKTKRNVIYVFGSNQITKQFVKDMCDFGFGPLIALIAEKEKLWMDEVKGLIDLLTLDDPEILYDETFYKKIEFKNAMKILILVDNKDLAQQILMHVRKVNKDAEIIVLSRNKPPILDLAEVHIEKIKILDDIEITKRALIRTVSIGFMYANAVEVPVPKEYIDHSPTTIESDFNGRIKVLGVKRGDEIIFPERLADNDLLILYLLDPKALKEFLQLLPISPFEKVELIEAEKNDSPKTP